MGRLGSKVALITGAARGIGAAVFRCFVREGAHVWLTDIEDGQGDALAAELQGRVKYAHLDVREEADWSSVTAALLQLAEHAATQRALIAPAESKARRAPKRPRRIKPPRVAREAHPIPRLPNERRCRRPTLDQQGMHSRAKREQIIE